MDSSVYHFFWVLNTGLFTEILRPRRVTVYGGRTVEYSSSFNKDNQDTLIVGRVATTVVENTSISLRCSYMTVLFPPSTEDGFLLPLSPITLHFGVPLGQISEGL